MKPVRNAVRCVVINGDKVLTTRYGKGNKKEGFYEIPGGKIEEGETAEQTAVREMKEETGIKISCLKSRGFMELEYPDRIFHFEVFYTTSFEGELHTEEEAIPEWISLAELMQKEKLLSNLIILNPFFMKGLLDFEHTLEIKVVVDDNENVLMVNYNKT